MSDSVRRVAAIDCGTNSIRLLVADISQADSGGDPRVLHDVERQMVIVRLGEGVDRTGEFSEAALERTFAACDAYAEIIARTQASVVRFVATSASRDVGNRATFVAGVRARLGVDPEVISGQEEASLSFTGAVRGLGQAVPPRLVVDIGGGSTEFVVGVDEPERAISVDIGCVRMTERHLHDDPPTAQQVAAAQADIDAAVGRALADVLPSAGFSGTLIGVAGTVTTVSAIAHGMSAYDPEALHGSVMTAGQVRQVTADLLAMPRAERAGLAVMHPGRVDVIAGGAMILRSLVDQSGAAEVLVSEHDILDGIAWSLGGA